MKIIIVLLIIVEINNNNIAQNYLDGFSANFFKKLTI